jgi:hypothetical protein
MRKMRDGENEEEENIIEEENSIAEANVTQCKKAEECLLVLKKFHEQNNLELQLGFVHQELYSIKKQIATSLKQSKVSDFKIN